MSNSDLVRFSRDGDQFHYLWASRRCLSLLSPTSGLIAVSIEGASIEENLSGKHVEAGEEIIDIGEYYGSEVLNEATFVRYAQLKHSTQQIGKKWTASGLEKTISGFAKRYKEFEKLHGVGTLDGKLEFCFVSNRPISSDILESINDVANNLTNRHPKELKKLEKFTGLSGLQLASFCKLLRIEGNHDGYWEQRHFLSHDITDYLPDADVDAPIRLKELVTRKALSESATNPMITKVDVLRALGTDESRLFPAPYLIKESEDIIPREQEAHLIREIVNGEGRTVIVHAAGGVGKSVFANRIKLYLPTGSKCIVYDCFGDGQYRNASSYRHRHKDALVQIVNELASNGLCYPLIPTIKADPTAYLKAFLGRIKQGINSIRSKHSDALLFIVVDAADNAQMAAEEISEPRSFARDLLREQMPEGVRLVMMCRTHRQDLLDPPPQTFRLELQPFSRAETATYLRCAFPDATEGDIDEFHRLSSHNPRLQATALSKKASLSEILRALGPNPTSVEDAISKLLKDAIDDLRYRSVSTEREQINLICAGLAVLRPLIPISVLATISQVDETAVRSFAFDIGRPLIVTGNTIQFFDEPAETWFREHFKPNAAQLKDFLEVLKPLTSQSAYIASALPQLMLEAGQFSELVEMALLSDGLPKSNPIERRDVELQRLQFALKASLRSKRHLDAVKLSLKAGVETAGDERQQKLLQDNTDLATVFLEVGKIQEIVSRRTFKGNWTGSHHVYEAGFMSGQSELLGDARSRLRMADEWLKNWSRLSRDEQESERIEDADIAELAFANFNIHGAKICAKELSRWVPREVSFRVGSILARRLIDHGRYDDLNQFALAAGNNLYLILAIVSELDEVHRVPPKEVVEHALQLVLNPKTKLKNENNFDFKETLTQSITSLIAAGLKYSTHEKNILATLLSRYLPKQPPRGLLSRYNGSRFTLLRAYALRATLLGQPLDLMDLAYPELRKELEKEDSHYVSSDAREFGEDIGALLPWHKLWANVLMGNITADELSAAIDETKYISSKALINNYREEYNTSNEIAIIWFDILVETTGTKTVFIDDFKNWRISLRRPLFTPTLTYLARVSARQSGMEQQSLGFVKQSYTITNDKRDDAETKAIAYVALSRAVLTVSESEAAAYFNKAVEVASKIGDEKLDRWRAILDLAERAANPTSPAPDLAYKLSRSAELIYDYVDRDKYFDWDATVTAIAGLCASSCITILSRWRDRCFGQTERLLPAAIQFLLEQHLVDSKIALALIGFRVYWDDVLLLSSALQNCNSKTDKKIAFELFCRYMRLDDHSASLWQSVKDLSKVHGLSLPDIDELIAFCEKRDRSVKPIHDNHSSSKSVASNREYERKRNAIFSNADLSSPNDILLIYGRFRELDSLHHYGNFFEEIYKHVKIGEEANFIKAISNVADFNLYDLQRFIEHFPTTWQSMLSVKPALTGAIKAFCRRHWMDIAKNRYFEIFPFKTACEISGMTEEEIIDEILSSMGEVMEVVEAKRLFTLVGLLVVKLSQSEAVEALSFGLYQFEEMLEARDGDGPWSQALTPPAEIDAAIAGYIWAGLATPKASFRWEAAHTVRNLCILDQKNLLEHLLTLAKSGKGEPFVDTQLHFYHLHALQWLLIALARVAKECPAILAPHSDFLFEVALNHEPHVLIRRFAARALLPLFDSDHLSINSDIQQRLINVNTSDFSIETSPRYNRHSLKRDQKESIQPSKEFFFGIDMGPYWFASLGRCFAMSQIEIEREAAHIIINEWGYSGYDNWEKDERARRKIFKDRETYHSHGSYPDTDNLHFYLCYHAMMIVAGKLLATVPLHQDPDFPEDEFEYWLSRHCLSRDDENWMADRRDSTPLDWPKWKNDNQENGWQQSALPLDFEQVLGLPDNRLNIWGHWTSVLGRREESIHVNSALVNSERSDALLRTLQTAINPRDYRIPDANDDLQIDTGGFFLKGWVINGDSKTGIDEFDPWAASIRYPPIVPAEFVVDLMNISHDSENRIWHCKDDKFNEEVLWAQVWNNPKHKDDESADEGGSRLQASLPFVIEFLEKMKMDLIVEIQINRKQRRYHYETRNNEDDYVPPATKLFLIKHEGRIFAI